MENLLTKECKHCKTKFTPERANRLYCSYSCKGLKAQRKRVLAYDRQVICVHHNVYENNKEPLAGDVVRLNKDYGNLKENTLGIILGTIGEKKDTYKIAFKPMLPPFISYLKEITVEHGTIISIEKDKLLHVGETNMVFSYPESRREDTFNLINEFKTTF